MPHQIKPPCTSEMAKKWQNGGEAYSVPNVWAGTKRIRISSENGVVQGRDVLCLTEQGYSVPEIWKGGKRISTLGGVQEMLCLTEQGLYFFLGRSDKPNALPYQMWIAGEVVPSIRKHGAYMTPQNFIES